MPVDDVAAAVRERMDRQRVLREGGRRLVFLLEEAVLHYRLVEPEVHAEQLEHLYEVMRLPSVSLGVIPLTADRRRPRPVEGFVIGTSCGSASGRNEHHKLSSAIPRAHQHPAGA